MAVKIFLAQAAHPVGTPGFAREDFDTGTPVSATQSGGPYAQYLWELVDKPIDLTIPMQSAALLTAPLAATTLINPVDLPGTYLIRLSVDSGSGLGATADDVAEITFYAGIPGSPLNPNPTLLPRRQIAFRETTQHNVQNDPIFGLLGNQRGWAQEWIRWFEVIQRLFTLSTIFAAGTVILPPGGPAALAPGSTNVLSVVRTSQGVVAVTFTLPAATANYKVLMNPDVSGGMFAVTLKGVGGFLIERSDIGGALFDEDFDFAVVT